MGGVISTVFGGVEDAAAGTESEPSRVLKFSSSARWQLHFNEIKESNKLVTSLRLSIFDSIRSIVVSMELTDLVSVSNKAGG